MVGGEILIRKKWKIFKKILKILLVVFLVIVVFAIIYFVGLSAKNTKQNLSTIVIENPLKNIVYANVNENGEVDKNKVIEQALLEFDVDYINYIFIALGVNNLYKSKIGFGNPKVEFDLDGEVWSSEINNGNLNTKKESIDDEDIRIIMSKKEIIESLLAKDIKEFMIESVKSRRTNIEMIAGKTELLSKGYLKMYSDLTGE